MKVCILTSSFPRFAGDSAGIFLYHLANNLIKKGVEIEIICPHENGCRFIEDWEGIKINRFPYFYPFRNQSIAYGSGMLQNIKQNTLAKIQLPFYIIAEFLYSLWIIKKTKADVIHAHWSLPQGLIGIICKGICNAPCVTTIHGSDVYGLGHPLLKAVNAKVIIHSDACTANSNATAGMARKISAKKDIKIVPMGVNPDFFKKFSCNKDALEKRIKIDGKIILFVGRLIDLKGIDYLIEAAPKVIERFPKARILLVGSGPRKDCLVKLTRDLNLENNVVFIEQVPQDELLKYYYLADIFVLPSIVNEEGETEGLGVVLLEAMACGVPVVGSGVGGIPDIIKDYETGLIAGQKDPDSLAEKIIKLLSNDRLREKLIKNGQKLIEEKYSWEIIADKFLNIYRNVVERKSWANISD